MSSTNGGMNDHDGAIKATTTTSSGSGISSHSAITTTNTFNSDVLLPPKSVIIHKDIPILGSGSFGEVHRASYSGETVVVKTIRFAGLSPKAKEDFHNEAKVLSRLTHPRIVRFYGVVEMDQETSPGGIGIVMEYVSKGSLTHYYQSNLCPEPKVRLQLALDIANGMSYLHNLKPPILHRDLKSMNVLVDFERGKLSQSELVLHAKLADFGLAMVKSEVNTSAASKSLSATSAGGSHAGPQGTLLWMAPELFDFKSTQLVEKSWDPEPRARPSFSVIARDLDLLVNGRSEVNATLTFDVTATGGVAGGAPGSVVSSSSDFSRPSPSNISNLAAPPSSHISPSNASTNNNNNNNMQPFLMPPQTQQPMMMLQPQLQQQQLQQPMMTAQPYFYQNGMQMQMQTMQPIQQQQYVTQSYNPTVTQTLPPSYPMFNTAQPILQHQYPTTSNGNYQYQNVQIPQQQQQQLMDQKISLTTDLNKPNAATTANTEPTKPKFQFTKRRIIIISTWSIILLAGIITAVVLLQKAAADANKPFATPPFTDNERNDKGDYFQLQSASDGNCYNGGGFEKCESNPGRSSKQLFYVDQKTGLWVQVGSGQCLSLT
ncbi:copper transport protein ctr1, partial [Blyttiomyces sp. JEL0837]